MPFDMIQGYFFIFHILFCVVGAILDHLCLVIIVWAAERLKRSILMDLKGPGGIDSRVIWGSFSILIPIIFLKIINILAKKGVMRGHLPRSGSQCLCLWYTSSIDLGSEIKNVYITNAKDLSYPCIVIHVPFRKCNVGSGRQASVSYPIPLR